LIDHRAGLKSKALGGLELNTKYRFLKEFFKAVLERSGDEQFALF
jgi:hypothetical protein